jgi:hypothetical protein
MKPSRRHVTLLVLVIGLASLLIPIDLRDAVERPGIGALEVAVFELSPFLVLALAARWLAWWLTIGCALVLGAFLLETAREVAESRSSTAGLAYLVVPVVSLMALLVVFAVAILVWAVRSARSPGAPKGV